jgi:hypothetical protein
MTARQAMGDALAEQILEIADDASTDLSARRVSTAPS